MKEQAIAIALLAAATTAACAQPRPAGPFEGLWTSPQVQTSRDDHSIWLHWKAERFQIGESSREQRTAPDAGRNDGVEITMTCRADDRPMGLTGPIPVATRLYSAREPEHRDTYNVLHPMYWWLGITGRSRTQSSASIEITGDGERIERRGSVERRRTAYSTPRPETEVQLPTGPVLRALRAGTAIEVRIQGAGTRIEATFPAQPESREAARRIDTYCEAD